MADAKEHFLEVGAGKPIFREGDAGSEMYIIESGTVDIVRAAKGPDPLAQLGPGDFFGEMSILEDQPRFASAMARTNVRLLRIDRAAFGEVLAQNVEIAIRIMRKLTARLRRAENRASEAHGALDDFKEKLSSRAPASAPTPVAPPAAAADRGAPQMRFRLRHAGSGQEFPLDGGAEFLVGRPDPVTGINPEVNLGPLDVSRSLSRRHAKLLVENGRCFLREDVGTTNGTFVNGERVRTGEPVALKPGDKIRFGAVEVEFAA
ncbi:MAG TPA: cyclic nucleotide-binding domain-containing protein [Xanthomonadales bacterium]|nr:cyclic nucleotide-binding domain-containing protein [Xanthomonadales bacterium]